MRTSPSLLKPGRDKIVSGSPDVDDVVVDRSGRSILGMLRLARTLRRDGFDLALVLPNSIRTAMLAFFARVPRRVGYKRDGRSLFLTDRISYETEVAPVRAPGRGRSTGGDERATHADAHAALLRKTSRAHRSAARRYAASARHHVRVRRARGGAPGSVSELQMARTSSASIPARPLARANSGLRSVSRRSRIVSTTGGGGVRSSSWGRAKKASRRRLRTRWQRR